MKNEARLCVVCLQVAVADVTGGDDLELLFGDVSGLLVCLKPDGTEAWTSRLEGVQYCSAVVL